MSKYDPLWVRVSEFDGNALVLSFEEIEQILGFKMDHSFLTFKNELNSFGWVVGKISMKDKTVTFEKL